MLFNVDLDCGDRIVGYFVPDAFSAVPSIRVVSNEKELLVVTANDRKDALVASGRHETGQCGFVIDSSLIPNLAQLADISLLDNETGLLLYKRPSQNSIAQKIIRLETHLLPLWRMDNALRNQFQYFARGVENLGRETVTQLFLLINVNSVWLSGRILYKNYAYFIESGFQTVALLHDPFVEFAERLLVLSKVDKEGLEWLGMRDSIGLKSAAEFARSLNFDDPQSLKRALRQLPAEVGTTFANPLVRQLTSATPDDMPTGGAVASALDLLSSFSLLGLRQEETEFRLSLSEMIGIPTETLPAMAQFPKVLRIADAIREMNVVNYLLEKDLELYHFVSNAIANAKKAAAEVEVG